jgi:outer membrane biosynthesis protein TonB
MNLDNRGLFGTILFHSFLLIIFLIFGFRTPLPLPGEQGILINFGEDETGFGNREPQFAEKTVKEVSRPKPVVAEKSEEELMTQEHEEAPVVKKYEKPKEKKIIKKVPTVKETEKPEIKKETVVEEKPKTDQRALYSGRKNNTNYTGSEGIAGGTGNQGSPTGSPDTDYHGAGSGSGNRPGFSLEGRSALSLPVPQYDIQKEGKVVVEIKVDREGNVISATPGVKGSTTVDSYLLGVAKTAALKSRFNNKADAEPVQKGTIVYIFSLR